MDVNTLITEMAKKIQARERPLQDQLLQMRVSKEFLGLIDDCRRRQTPIPGRTEVVRNIVESALQHSKWRLIKTAPKDVEIIGGHEMEGWVLPVVWHPKGWQASGGKVNPTHWQPFPTPPQRPSAA